MSSNICLTGGAVGSDYAWNIYANKAGHKVVNFVFEDHKTTAIKASTVISLTSEQLATSLPALTQAIIRLKRSPIEKRSEYVQNLLKRNWWQVRQSDSCYAVGVFRKGLVGGGTGYAVQMFMDRYTSADRPKGGLYFFDQENEKWFQYNPSWARWDEIDYPPKPAGTYAGIGTREINFSGKSAIKDVFR